MLRLVFTERAQADLLDAWLYIAEDNLAAADKVLDTVEQEAKLLLLQPLMGRARSELGSTVRSWPSATPYVVFYEVDDSELTVLRVLHHARDVRPASF
jgi:addiction module RelE/StbE family toxin